MAAPRGEAPHVVIGIYPVIGIVAHTQYVITKIGFLIAAVVNYTAHTAFTPTVWDTVALILLESVCALVLLLSVF